MFSGREPETTGDKINHGLRSSIGQITEHIDTDFLDFCKDKIGRIDIGRHRPDPQPNTGEAGGAEGADDGSKTIVSAVTAFGPDTDLPGGEGEIVADNECL